jgi:AcrR family transcriptional regulator
MAMSPRTMKTPRRPRRDAAATRAAILASARRHFAARGYEHAGVRDIAAEAGVTAALVNRYFGTKEQLFREALEDAFVLPTLLPASPSELGAALAPYAAHPASRRKRDFDPLQLMLSSVGSPAAAAIVREALDRRSIGALAAWLGGEDAELRAALIVSCMAGLAVVRKMVGSRAFSAANEDRLEELFAPVLQACVAAPTQQQVAHRATE